MSIDVEQAFADANDVMQLLEQLVQHVCKDVKDKCARELVTLKHTIKIPEVPFKRVTYDEALAGLKREGVEIPWGEDIPTPALRALGKIHHYFYFLTDWPTHSMAFYIKPRDDNPELSEGFDLMWRFLELVSGGTRIADKELLKKRLTEKGLEPESFKHHLQAVVIPLKDHNPLAVHGPGNFA